MMRTRWSMFSTAKLRCRFAEACFSGLVQGRYFTNHLKTFISLAVTRVRRNQRGSWYFLSKMKEHRFSLPFNSFGREQISPTKPFCVKQSSIPYVEAPINSKAAQLREKGTEIVRLFARFALGASFLSAVADRFGLWGPYGAKNVSWGNFAHFVEYTGKVTSLFPTSLTVSFAWAATVAETLFGILLIAGFKIRMA